MEEADLWRQLGNVHTQDEKELAGMRALEEAVRLYSIAQDAGALQGRERESMGETLMVSQSDRVRIDDIGRRGLIKATFLLCIAVSCYLLH